MSNAGRPRKATTVLEYRIPDHLLALLVLTRPELFKPGQPGVFKHGHLSDYISRLISRDLKEVTSGNSTATQTSG